MNTDKYIRSIDELLRQMAQLEKNLQEAEGEYKFFIQRSLKNKNKRFEHLIPYKFRLQLKNICRDAGVIGQFD